MIILHFCKNSGYHDDYNISFVYSYNNGLKDGLHYLSLYSNLLNWLGLWDHLSVNLGFLSSTQFAVWLMCRTPLPICFHFVLYTYFFDMELQVVSLLENTKMIWKLMCPNPLSSMLVETWRMCFSGERTHFYAFWRERTFQI